MMCNPTLDSQKGSHVECVTSPATAGEASSILGSDPVPPPIGDFDVYCRYLIVEENASYVTCDVIGNDIVVEEEASYIVASCVIDFTYVEQCDYDEWCHVFHRERMVEAKKRRRLRISQRNAVCAARRVAFREKQRRRKKASRDIARYYKQLRRYEIIRKEELKYGLSVPDTPDVCHKSAYSQRYDLSTLNMLSEFPNHEEDECRNFVSQANQFSELWSSVEKAGKVYKSVEEFKTTLNSLKSVIAFKNKSEDEWVSNLLKRLEMIALLFTGISTSTSVVNLMSVIGMYIESWDEGPLGPKLYTLITNLFKGDESVDEEGDGKENLKTQAKSDDEIETGIANMRAIFTNWREFINCELAQKMVALVNILITAGFFPDVLRNADDLTMSQLKAKFGENYRIPKNMKFAPCGIHLFSVKVWDVQKESVSFFDMIVDTALFFVERGYAAFKYRDLSLLMHSDKHLCLMDKEYSILVTAARQLDIGTLDENPELHGLADYEYRLESLIHNIGAVMKVTQTDYMRNTLTNRLIVLRKCRIDLMAYLKKSPIKEKPFGTLIYGASGIGKSTINAILTKVLLHANGLPNKKQHIVTLNANDEFQSELKSSHTAVLLDDWCNKKCEWHKMSPTDLLIQLLNNIPSAALSPIAENKGLIWPRPKLVTVTTNVKHLMAAQFSNEPASVLRRFELIFDVRLKKDCVDSQTGTLDGSKCAGVKFPELPDCWDITVQYVKIIKTKGTGPDGYEFVDVTPNPVSLEEAVNIAIEWSKKHYVKQANLVKDTEDFFDMELCPHNKTAESCVQCDCERARAKMTETEAFEDALDNIPKVKDRMETQCVDDEEGVNPFDSDSTVPPVQEGTIVALPPLESVEAQFPSQTELCRDVAKGAWLPPVQGHEPVFSGPKDVSYVPRKEIKTLVDAGLIVKVDKFYYYVKDDFEVQAKGEDRSTTAEFNKGAPSEEKEMNLFDKLKESVESSTKFFKQNYASEMDIIHSYADADEEPDMHALEDDILEDPGTEHVTLKSWCKRWYEDRKISCLTYKKDAETTLKKAYDKSLGSLSAETCMALGIPVTAFIIVKMFQHFRRSTLQTQSAVRYPEPGPNDKPNPFKQPLPNTIPLTETSKTTTHVDLVTAVGKLMGHARITNLNSQTSISCCCFPLKGNVWLLPKHVFHPGADHKIQVTTGYSKYLGKSFTQNIEADDMIQVAPDLMLVSLRSGGSVRDFSKYLVEDEWDFKKDISGHLVVKTGEGQVLDIFGRVTRKKFFDVNAKSLRYEGIGYQMDNDLKVGYCMAPFIPATRRATILGFHLAGDTVKKNHGVGGLLTKKSFDEAYADLEDRGLVAHSEGTLVVNTYGIDIGYKQTVHKLHPINQIVDVNNEAHVRVVGSHEMPTITFRSKVKKSPISAKLTEITGLEREHGAPDPRDFVKHYARDIDQMAKTKGDFVPSIMSKAEKDLTNKFVGFVKSNPDVTKLVHPYPKEVILSGFDNIGSVDRLVQNSSMGFPVNKPKSQFMSEVEEDIEGISSPIDFDDPKYWQEVERMEATLLKGERVNVVFRANLKDEPTKFTKEKIRVFAGCPIAFTCLVRKYFLSLVRLIQNYPLEFECAVGVNPHSRQWSSIVRKLQSHNTNRMVAGDYKAYDKSVTCDTMMRAFRVLISVAKAAGYDDDQIKIMRGIATEISSPLYEVHGAFLMMYGSNPSGHPLTVIINNVFNSLYMRYAYYTLHKTSVPRPFDEMVSLICYGDDNVMSVSEEETKFNHTSVSHVLSNCGVTYTMADKTSESRPFITLDEVDFLKRGMKWNEDLCEWVAPISESSIQKCIHNYQENRKCDLLPAEICAQSLYSAGLEYFHHGRVEYDRRVAQFVLAAQGTEVEKYMMRYPTYEELSERFLSGPGMNFLIAEEFSEANLTNQ